MFLKVGATKVTAPAQHCGAESGLVLQRLDL